MKIYMISLYLILFAFSKSEEVEVKDEANYTRLNKHMLILIKQIEKEMPPKVKKAMKNCNNYMDINNLEIDIQNWIFDAFLPRGNKEIMEEFENSNYLVTGDDIPMLYKNCFINYLNNKPFKLKEELQLVDLYWKERKLPTQTISPIGKNKINWIMGIATDKRPHGVIHVGVDKKTKQYICYERTIGIYYPEGKLLVKIREQDIKDPWRNERNW